MESWPEPDGRDGLSLWVGPVRSGPSMSALSSEPVRDPPRTPPAGPAGPEFLAILVQVAE
jgi:hypothetical protein